MYGSIGLDSISVGSELGPPVGRVVREGVRRRVSRSGGTNFVKSPGVFALPLVHLSHNSDELR